MSRFLSKATLFGLLEAAAEGGGELVSIAVAGALPVPGVNVVAGVAAGQATKRAAAWMLNYLRPLPPAEAAAALESAANLSRDEARDLAAEVVAKVAPPAMDEASRQRLTQFIEAIPQAMRASMQHDPASGRSTVPADLLPRTPEDMERFLPPMPPFVLGTDLPGTSYRLTEVLGSGGFGMVYKAVNRQEEYGDPRAIKFCLDPAKAASLRREQRIFQTLLDSGERWSERIVRLYGTRLDTDPPYLIYEYVDGGDLAAHMARHRRATGRAFNDAEAGQLVRQVAEGLAVAHARGLVHRDLKPSNILMADGKPKLADFGIGVVLRGGNGGAAVTAAGGETVRRTGTPMYMSEEQRRGDEADPRHDLFSLGVVWYQLLAGDADRPLTHGWRKELQKHHGVPAATLDLIERCVGMIDERPADARELLALLAQRDQHAVHAVGAVGVSAAGGGATREPARESVHPPARKRGLVGPLLAFAVLAAVVVAVFMNLPARRQELQVEAPRQPAPLPAASVAPNPPGRRAAPKPAPLTPVEGEFVNSVGMRFAPIAAGEFQMGSPEAEKSRGRDERHHSVAITRPFLMQRTEVTLRQWREVMGADHVNQFDGDDVPVDGVSWRDAMAFCDALGRRENRTYRLPTEAEWEYACRAGTAAPFFFGETLSTEQANYNGGRFYGAGFKGDSPGRTTPAGCYPPNAWGLYDMHGNVSEWCADWYAEYPPGDQTNPAGPLTGSDDRQGRVVRGGSWSADPVDCRSARRGYAYAHNPTRDFGFRVVLDSPRPPDTQLAGRAARRAPGETITNSLGMKLAWIAPGEFLMGSPPAEEGRHENETQHRVKLAKGYFVGTTLVTQAQFQALMGVERHPKRGPDYPVEQVAYEEAAEFCYRLGRKEDRTYRLPTEAEWEYACRAGTTTPFWFGKTIDPTRAHYNANHPYGKDGKPTRGFQLTYHPKPVGGYPANPWGLHDMHGNLFQWCSDWYAPYPAGDAVDPRGPAAPPEGPGRSHRVQRGGSWLVSPSWCRSAYRGHQDDPGTDSGFRTDVNVGFRVVLDAP